jgi:hypothetical protein
MARRAVPAAFLALHGMRLGGADTLPPLSTKDIAKQTSEQSHRNAADTTTIPETDPVSLETMLSIGRSIMIGEREYEIARFSARSQAKAMGLLAKLPEMLRMHAIAAAQNGGRYDIANTAALLQRYEKIGQEGAAQSTQLIKRVIDALNSLRAEKDESPIDYPDDLKIDLLDSSPMPGLSTEVVGLSLYHMNGLAEEHGDVMTDLTLLAVQRKHPDASWDEIDMDLELDTFMDILLSIYSQNEGMRKRF